MPPLPQPRLHGLVKRKATLKLQLLLPKFVTNFFQRHKEAATNRYERLLIYEYRISTFKTVLRKLNLSLFRKKIEVSK